MLGTSGLPGQPWAAAARLTLLICAQNSVVTWWVGMQRGRARLRAEQVLDVPKVAQLPVDDEAVRQPARLRALPAVRAPPAPRLGAEALPADAQRNTEAVSTLQLRMLHGVLAAPRHTGRAPGSRLPRTPCNTRRERVAPVADAERPVHEGFDLGGRTRTELRAHKPRSGRTGAAGGRRRRAWTPVVRARRSFTDTRAAWWRIAGPAKVTHTGGTLRSAQNRITASCASDGMTSRIATMCCAAWRHKAASSGRCCIRPQGFRAAPAQFRQRSARGRPRRARRPPGAQTRRRPRS